MNIVDLIARLILSNRRWWGRIIACLGERGNGSVVFGAIVAGGGLLGNRGNW